MLGKKAFLLAKEYIVGRGHDCTIGVRDDESVSRKHMKLDVKYPPSKVVY